MKSSKSPQFSNLHLVTNPFKPGEDPLELHKKKVLTKQEILMCETIYKKAKKHNVLGPDGKVDRTKCKQALDKLENEGTNKDLDNQLLDLTRQSK